MPQTREVHGVATSVRTNGEWTHVRYHDTDVVSFTRDKIVLRSGGWETATTKLRMNQTAAQFGLGFKVYQRQHKWRVYVTGRSVVAFVDGMTFVRPRVLQEQLGHV